MKAAYIAVGAIAVIAWLVLGFVIAAGPQPEIIVPAEIITKIGPLNISNTLITSWISMAILIIVGFIATRSMSLVPSGVQNFVEAVIDFLVTQIEEIAGHERGRHFFMVIATFFLFILVANWTGLLPIFNAIGKTEDVGDHVFHEIEEHAAEGHAFEEEEHFAAWKMDSGSVDLVKARAGEFEFTIHPDTEPQDALGQYIVALAESYTDFERAHVEGEDAGHGGEVTDEDIVGAAAALEADPDAPKLLFAETAAEGDGEEHEGEAEEHHGVHVAALDADITSIEYPGQMLGLIIPYFRSAFSDVNNTLALGICSFLVVEFWGFQALGLGYLKKFFNFSSPINFFVGFLELLSELIRMISFAFRLFGNIFAGEVLILMLTFLVPFLLVNVIYGLELFVGFIQAAVFALLTLVFATMAVEGHGEEHEHEAHGEAEGHH